MPPVGLANRKAFQKPRPAATNRVYLLQLARQGVRKPRTRVEILQLGVIAPFADERYQIAIQTYLFVDPTGLTRPRVTTIGRKAVLAEVAVSASDGPVRRSWHKLDTL
jgi:hypothetical protein